MSKWVTTPKAACTCGTRLRVYSTSTSIPTPPTTGELQKDLVKQVRKSDWKRRQEGSNFVDTLSINLHSGKGGAGGVAFHREKFKAKGPPSGGPGGSGGSVYLLASTSVTSLSHLPRTVRGGSGNPGGGKWLGGKSGEDMVIRVPVGTVVREVRWEIEGEVEKERNEREEMEWAWDASKVRLAEAERREKSWDIWKKKKDTAIKEGGEYEPFDELDPVDVPEHKQQALERIRRTLFVTYPMTDLASHPSFLYSEHQLLSKLLSRQAANKGKKTRRRRAKPIDEDDSPLYLDLTKPTPASDPILLLSGGQPGLGNPSFQLASDRSPKYATRGGDGESMRLELELKAGGEVGLVGMPNAGKSTILRALTSSTPRVAAYPFTTLNPHHGTCVLYSDSTFSGPRDNNSITDTSYTPETFSGATQFPTRDERRKANLQDPNYKPRTEIFRFTMTDNPGLVPLSSLNVGLGHAFLRHIERCSALVYVIDLSAENPVAALDAVRKELREYARMKGLDGELEGRVRGIVANKADLFGPERQVVGEDVEEDSILRSTAEVGRQKLENLIKYVREMEAKEVEEGIRKADDSIWVVPTSAKRRENVAALVEKLVATVKEERRRTLEAIEEEERSIEEERLAAIDMLAGN